MTTDPILSAPRSVQELHRDMPIQRATWKVQRIGWWVLVLMVLTGLAGLFGEGPIARTTARSANAAVQYDRVVRRGADSLIRFDVQARRDTVTLTLPSAYLDAVELEALQPEPVAGYGGQETYTFVFAARDRQARILLKVRPRHVGPLDFAPRLDGQLVPTHSPFALP